MHWVNDRRKDDVMPSVGESRAKARRAPPSFEVDQSEQVSGCAK